MCWLSLEFCLLAVAQAQARVLKLPRTEFSISFCFRTLECSILCGFLSSLEQNTTFFLSMFVGRRQLERMGVFWKVHLHPRVPLPARLPPAPVGTTTSTVGRGCVSKDGVHWKYAKKWCAICTRTRDQLMEFRLIRLCLWTKALSANTALMGSSSSSLFPSAARGERSGRLSAVEGPGTHFHLV